MHILYWLILMNTFHNHCMFFFTWYSLLYNIQISFSSAIDMDLMGDIHCGKPHFGTLFFFIWNTIFWFIHVLYFLIIWSKWKLKLYLLENWFNFIRSISWYLCTEKTLKKTKTIFVNSINNQFVPSIFFINIFHSNIHCI